LDLGQRLLFLFDAKSITVEHIGPVVLKRVPRGSLWNEFFYSWEEICSRGNWGGKPMDEKN